MRADEATARPARVCVFVVDGAHHLDENKVTGLLGVGRREWRLARQLEIERDYGIQIGGVPPFGYRSGVHVYFDRGLLTREYVLCGTGDPRRSVRRDPSDLIKVASAQVVDIAASGGLPG